jgi:hypothetical protein
MQQEISDAVRLWIGAPPNLLVAEQLQAALDLGEKVFGEVMSGTGNEGLANFIHMTRLSPLSIPLPAPAFPVVVCVSLCARQDALSGPAWPPLADDPEARAAGGSN